MKDDLKFVGSIFLVAMVVIILMRAFEHLINSL
jgi:hypothetical protein